jgi:poly(3-hydroxybutyrate) depolymerase
MRGHGVPPPARLADLVRAASSHSGDWPTLSVWHGSADGTVDQSNAAALVEQWRALHGAAETPSKADLVQGYPRRVWCDISGREVVEEYSITGFGHGTPLDTRGSHHGENAGPFMLEAGISSTHLIGRFWGIVSNQAEQHRSRTPAMDSRAAKPRPQLAQASAWTGPAGIGKTIEDALRAAGLMK